MKFYPASPLNESSVNSEWHAEKWELSVFNYAYNQLRVAVHQRDGFLLTPQF